MCVGQTYLTSNLGRWRRATLLVLLLSLPMLDSGLVLQLPLRQVDLRLSKPKQRTLPLHSTTR